eukprot:scaffold98543_cov75-Phaeocystis_antarctica.AAC.2
MDRPSRQASPPCGQGAWGPSSASTSGSSVNETMHRRVRACSRAGGAIDSRTLKLPTERSGDLTR